MKAKHQKTAEINRIYRYYRRPFPNAADPGYFLEKVANGLLSLATCMGSITVFFFLVMLASGAGVGAILLFMLANA